MHSLSPRHPWLATLLAGALAALLAGCDSEPTANRYFPLEPGRSWTYRVTSVIDGETTRSRYGVETLAPMAREASEDTPAETWFGKRDSNGTEYWFRLNAGAVERVAKRRLVDYVPVRDVPALPVLPPAEAENPLWQVPSQLYALGRRVDFGDRSTTGHPLRLTYSVLETDASVTLGERTFEHCLLVEGEAYLELYLDGRRGFVKIPVTQREWYAPEVGLVRLERDEPVDADLFFGGTVTYELIDFDS